MGTMQRLQTFTLFPSLPIELRHQIYASTIQPRLVRLETKCIYEDVENERDQPHYFVRSSATIPALLSTGREARDSMQLAGYQLSFENDDSEPRIWFNRHYDTVYLRANCVDLTHYLRLESLARVEKLALGGRWIDHKPFGDAMSSFANLKELLWVFEDFSIDIHGLWWFRETRINLLRQMNYDFADLIDDQESVQLSFSAWKTFKSMFCTYQTEGIVSGGGLKGFSEERFFHLRGFWDEHFSEFVRDVRSASWSIPKTKLVGVIKLPISWRA